MSSNDSDIASPLPRHSTDDTRHLEVEIERCAIEKARERMELELCMVEEKYMSGEEDELVCVLTWYPGEKGHLLNVRTIESPSSCPPP